MIQKHRASKCFYFRPVGVQADPDFVGNSGLSGALACYAPQEQITISSKVNQLVHPDISFRTIIKLTPYVMKK
ncbi:MAG: hypothetical protein ACK5QZ_03545 [Bacteroidota bacterium]